MQQDDTNIPVDECCTAHCSTADDDCWLSSALLTYCWKLAAIWSDHDPFSWTDCCECIILLHYDVHVRGHSL